MSSARRWADADRAAQEGTGRKCAWLDLVRVKLCVHGHCIPYFQCDLDLKTAWISLKTSSYGTSMQQGAPAAWSRKTWQVTIIKCKINAASSPNGMSLSLEKVRNSHIMYMGCTPKIGP